MGLISRLLGSDADESTRPERPANEVEERTFEETRRVSTIEYANGDTEEVTHYGMYFDEGAYVFTTEVNPKGMFADDIVTMTGSNKRTIPAEVLARDPETVSIGEETRIYKLTYSYKWGVEGYGHISQSKSWVRELVEIVEVDRSVPDQ